MQRDEIVSFLKAIKEDPQNTLFDQIGLFGSYARDKADISSDIDIAVRVNKAILAQQDVWSYFDAIDALKSAVRKRFGLLVDVFDLDSDAPIKEKIEREILYV